VVVTEDRRNAGVLYLNPSLEMVVRERQVECNSCAEMPA